MRSAVDRALSPGRPRLGPEVRNVNGIVRKVPEAPIRHFATHPEWVRRGVGTSLLARCISDARPLGIHKLHCLSTLNAERFYQASGFDPVGPIDVPMGPTLTFPGVLLSRELA